MASLGHGDFIKIMQTVRILRNRFFHEQIEAAHRFFSLVVNSNAQTCLLKNEHDAMTYVSDHSTHTKSILENLSEISHHGLQLSMRRNAIKTFSCFMINFKLLWFNFKKLSHPFQIQRPMDPCKKHASQRGSFSVCNPIAFWTRSNKTTTTGVLKSPNWRPVYFTRSSLGLNGMVRYFVGSLFAN